MEQAKVLITPFELFSSTIGGITIVVAAILLYKGISDIHVLHSFIHQSIDIKNLVLLIFMSFLFGGLSAGITYKIYKKISSLLKMNNKYYDISRENIIKFNEIDDLSKKDFLLLSHVDKIGYLLSRRVNNIESFYKSIISTIPYIRQHDIYAVRLIEHNLAQHIMYRGLFFGFSLMGGAILFNMIKFSSYNYDSFLFFALTIIASILSFYKCANFLKWHRREIMNSFYQIAFRDTFEKNRIINNLQRDNEV